MRKNKDFLEEYPIHNPPMSTGWNRNQINKDNDDNLHEGWVGLRRRLQQQILFLIEFGDESWWSLITTAGSRPAESCSSASSGFSMIVIGNFVFVKIFYCKNHLVSRFIPILTTTQFHGLLLLENPTKIITINNALLFILATPCPSWLPVNASVDEYFSKWMWANMQTFCFMVTLIYWGINVHQCFVLTTGHTRTKSQVHFRRYFVGLQ